MHTYRPPDPASFRSSAWVFVTLAGAACALTLLFLGVRGVMEVGGACADGIAPYVIERRCPPGTVVSIFGGVFGGLACVGLYAWHTSTARIPSLTALAWPALFLSLGWNFVEYGLRPPFGEGLVWGWVFVGLVFVAIGGVPLAYFARPTLAAFARYTGEVRPVRPRAGPTYRSAPWPETPNREALASAVVDADGWSGSLVHALERLAELHRTGVLDDAEFQAAKRRVIAQEDGPR
jgi:hypothetical protein